MTEITEITEASWDAGATELSPAISRFVLHWGDLGAAWGINRSVAQIHALLFVSERPLNAEDIAAALQVARSNVSTSLKELIGWGLVRRVPALGDRRDYFAAEGDVFEMARKILAVRKAREFDPAAELLASSVEALRAEPEASPETTRRLAELQDLISTLSKLYDETNAMPKAQLLALIGLGSKAVDLLRPFLGREAGTGNREP